MQTERTRSMLLFANVSARHYGNYTCRAANRLGTSSASMRLLRASPEERKGRGHCGTDQWLSGAIAQARLAPPTYAGPKAAGSEEVSTQPLQEGCPPALSESGGARRRRRLPVATQRLLL